MNDYRVLHVLPDLAVGGGQVMVLRLSKGLRESGVRVFVAAYGSCNDMIGQFERAGVPVIELGCNGLRDVGKAVRRIEPHLKAERISLLHTHGTPVDKILGHLLSRRNKIPHVTTLHGMPPLYDIWNGPIRARMRGAFHNAIFGFDWWCSKGWLQGTTSVSDAVHDAWDPVLKPLRQYGPFEDRVIYWGVEPDAYCQVDSETITLIRSEILGDPAGQGPLLVCVSRLEESKNVGVLPEAMEHIVERWPGAVLAIAGDGPERQSLERMADKLCLQKHVRFLGRRNDIPALLAAADISVFPSQVEGFGLVVLESLAAGTPVVCFDLPSLRILRGQVNAIRTAKAASAQSLGETVCNALKDHELKGLGLEARKTVLNSWTLDQTVKSYDDLYRSVLSSNES